MTFIQIIEMRTTNFDEIQQARRANGDATEGRRTLRRSIVARDRKDPERHLVIVFFDSYESAMANSNLPETTAFGEKQTAFLDGSMQFTDYDVHRGPRLITHGRSRSRSGSRRARQALQPRRQGRPAHRRIVGPRCALGASARCGRRGRS